MISKIAVVISLIVATAGGLGSACATTSPGTDSNTHWIKCQTVADCPDGGSYSCTGGRCTPVDADAAAPASGGSCPASAAGNAPCDGSIAQCWTQCTQGFREQFVCSGGTWIAGHGLFPCGVDGGSSGAGGATGSGDVSSGGAAGSGGAPIPTDAQVAPADAIAIRAETSCSRNADCTLTNYVCCPSCSEPALGDKLAINLASYPEWQAAICRDPVACPPCVPPPGPFQAECHNGACEAVNLAQYKECLKDDDCKVQPVDCCPCGTLTRTDVTAINASANYPGCLGFCESCPGGVSLPPDVHASCNLGGGYCVLD